MYISAPIITDGPRRLPCSRRYAQNEGIQTVPLSDYEETQIEGYLGSIYLHERNAKLKELADTIEVFHPILPATGYSVTNAYKKNELPVIDETQTNYLVFLGGTHGPYRVLEGGYHTGRNMLLICDSFGNAIAPFFMPYYDDVYMVDFRDAYYSRTDAEAGVREYIQRCGIDDVYIVLRRQADRHWLYRRIMRSTSTEG
jgi:hypothetical protein